MKAAFVSMLALIMTFASVGQSWAQNDPLPVQCGTILEDELTATIETQRYSLPLSAGDEIVLESIGLADSFWHDVRVSSSTGQTVGYETGTRVVRLRELVGAADEYVIEVGAIRNTIGLFTLSIGCTLADGTVIEPGDAPPPPTAEPLPLATYPDLAPTSFENAIALPLLPGTPMSGAVSSTEVYSYSVEAQAGAAELRIERLSGTLNLGIVLVSPGGQVMFYGGLVASSSIAAMLDLPESGTYVVTIFPVSVTPPANPQPAVFQVTFAPATP